MGERLIAMDETVLLLQRLVALRTQREANGNMGGASDGHTPIRLYYLSNMPQPYARALEQSHDFFQAFDGGIFSGDVQHIKPEPAIYQLLQTRYALDPARTVFIDDLLGNVHAAHTQGWHGIHFHNAQQTAQALEPLILSEIDL
jgi:putative hydrolase of the HAD superfamily